MNMKWYAINELELMSFHMASALHLGRNTEAQEVVNGIRAREISYTKERPANVTQHSNGAEPAENCPSCTGCELRDKGCMEKPGSVACARDAGKLRHC